MSPREFVAWALLSVSLIVILFGAQKLDVTEASRQGCEDAVAETLDLCGRVVTKLAAKCGECP
ncbi:MAG: hypothetical protein ACREMO_08645 [Gemmatimonadales bacterium]